MKKNKFIKLLFKKVYNKLCIHQWSIGITRISLFDFFKYKNIESDYKWMTLNSNFQFCADPFVFKNPDGFLNIVYEEFSFEENYGKIYMTTFSNEFDQSPPVELLDTKSHLSYPFVFVEKESIHIIPEASKSGVLSSYNFDFKTNTLKDKKDIINGLALLDSTILKYNNKYWLFATHSGLFSNSQLFIYYSNHFDGPYFEHSKNPVKNNLDSSRPAGNFIEFNGEIYRPTQNSAESYGKSITINKICLLNENEFEEETYFKILPPANTEFVDGLHTINIIDGFIVIDGLRSKFNPIFKIKNKINNMMKTLNYFKCFSLITFYKILN